ncbi:right-handed parallel beta-helix repeat-containing protein [Paenibacillus sp. J5C_2022]|uniref:right-handed parallel beta-helix repeat-containing protein n=1 Tax=Paenibacillus sp. J5C2022 TaxID=2977129 RepID=UPI0021CF6C0E|nr:NosD domain-containing protein [Paenibacillus sp. J5C2022]MCU6712010.1 right-handed parallel beta-helix repeat-containing protein [Paenibacillus sp. J5C2022]
MNAGGQWRRSAIGLLILLSITAVQWLHHPPEIAASGSSLQALIDHADPGAKIVIPSGSYTGPIRIAKTISLIAEQDATVTVTNESEEPAISITADDVSIVGITVNDESMKEAPSVLVEGDRVLLKGLSIATGSDGIQLRGTQGGKVDSSSITWGASDRTKIFQRGNGIDLFEAHAAELRGNSIVAMYDGIYMENSDDTLVAANTIRHSRYGVHCMYTKGTVVQDNIGSMNITGAMIMSVQEVIVERNEFAKQNENVNSQGILLYDAHHSILRNNITEGNRVGLYIEQSASNTIENNEMINNFTGLQLLSSEGNIIQHNSFIGNVNDAGARSSSGNEIKENFWDSFQGIDATGDGSSDIPYAVNPFFETLVKKKPVFQLFFQSPGMVFLEGLYQSQRSDWARDEAPLLLPLPSIADPSSGTANGLTGILGTCMLIGAGSLLFAMRRRDR